jgi:tRNA C32,U32 (ribose-2'-O)-methylase TrmJ
LNDNQDSWQPAACSAKLSTVTEQFLAVVQRTAAQQLKLTQYCYHNQTVSNIAQSLRSIFDRLQPTIQDVCILPHTTVRTKHSDAQTSAHTGNAVSVHTQPTAHTGNAVSVHTQPTK